jgi:hypothetical protein
MSDGTITIIIASLTILLGGLILIARFTRGQIKSEPGNPSAKAARGEIIVLAIVMIIGGLIVIIREV